MSPSQGNGGNTPLAASDDAVQPEEAPAQAGAEREPDRDEEDGTAPKPQPGPRLCGICNTGVGKYKCPRCSMPYCSVACNRIHKENHPPTPEKPQAPAAQPLPQQPSNNTNNSNNAPDDPYSVLLDHTSDFARLFKKYPLLQSELSRIQQTTLQPDTTTTNPVLPFQQGRGRGGGGGGKHHTWSREAGLRQGAAALRKARTDPGDRGDGVREFCDLVLYLLAAPSSRREVRDKDATSLVREEVVAEEAKIIERLLLEEGGGEG